VNEKLAPNCLRFAGSSVRGTVTVGLGCKQTVCALGQLRSSCAAEYSVLFQRDIAGGFDEVASLAGARRDRQSYPSSCATATMFSC